MARTIRFGALVALAALLGACGPEGGICDQTCTRISSCTAGAADAIPAGMGWSCPRTGCSEVDACQAQCILDAPCAAVAGSDPAGVDGLRSCITLCASLGKPDSPQAPLPPDAGPPPPDAGPPPCVPQCNNKGCGDDGCGGQCGVCASHLVCDPQLSLCKPKTPPSCYSINQCLWEGQKTCTAANKYRQCVKGYNGCLIWDCST